MAGASSPVVSAVIGLIGFTVLFAVLVLALRWLQRRMGQPAGAAAGDIRIVRRVPLGWQCMLVVVEVAGHQYILTTSRNGAVTVVDELAEPLAEAPGPGDFASRLAQAVRKRKDQA